MTFSIKLNICGLSVLPRSGLSLGYLSIKKIWKESVFFLLLKYNMNTFKKHLLHPASNFGPKLVDETLTDAWTFSPSNTKHFQISSQLYL